GNRQSTIGNDLSLRELEALARTLLSVLLTFFDSRIAGNQSRLLQRRPQISVVFDESARDAMTNGARLSRGAAASDVYKDVELVRRLSQIQRLPNNHAQRFIRKVRIESFTVDDDVTTARPQINAGGCSLASPSSVILNICHVLNPF